MGRLLTLATSSVSQNALQAGSVAAAASARKTTKYSTLSATHMFFSGGGRDSWSFVRRGSQRHSLIVEISRRATLLHSRSAENYLTFLYQRISVAIQRFNAVCLANTSPHCNYSGHTIFAFANFMTLGMKYQCVKIIIINIQCDSEVTADEAAKQSDT